MLSTVYGKCHDRDHVDIMPFVDNLPLLYEAVTVRQADVGRVVAFWKSHPVVTRIRVHKPYCELLDAWESSRDSTRTEIWRDSLVTHVCTAKRTYEPSHWVTVDANALEAECPCAPSAQEQAAKLRAARLVFEQTDPVDLIPRAPLQEPSAPLTREELLATIADAELFDPDSLKATIDLRFTFNELPMRLWMESGGTVAIEVVESSRRQRFDVGFNQETQVPQIAWIGEPNDSDLVMAADVMLGFIAKTILSGGALPQFQFTEQ